MAAPRRVKLEELVALNKNPNIKILSRAEDPNLVNVRCNICFDESQAIKKDFLGQVKFPSEDDAFSFEKELFLIFSKYRLHQSQVRHMILSGFTECFSEDCLDDLLTIFNEKKGT